MFIVTKRGCDNWIRVSCSAGYGELSCSENCVFGGDANLHSVAVVTTVVGSDGTECESFSEFETMGNVH